MKLITKAIGNNSLSVDNINYSICNFGYGVTKGFIYEDRKKCTLQSET